MDEGKLEGGRFLMEHIEKETLGKYCANQLPEEEQSIIDQHITECESCFSLYLDMIENFHIEHSVSDTFTDRTIEEIERSQSFNQDNIPSMKQSRIMTHYFLAAGLTLLLTFSGLFNHVLDLTEQTGTGNRVSISEQLMNKTTDILDHMKEDNNK
jgi:predicted anti-sigma-YlaC factor YlaD